MIRAPFLALALAAAAPAQETPSGMPEAGWKELDAEARYVAYRADALANPGRRAAWVKFFAGHSDFELLEWIVLTEGWLGWPDNKTKPGDALVHADAPQWIRCALWSLGHFDSHGLGATQSALKDRPDLVRGWLDLFPEAKKWRNGDKLAVFENATPADAKRYLPPLDPEGVVLPFLDAPPEPEALTGKRADPKKRYLHQVLRAIEMLVTAGLWDEPYASKLIGLVRHPDARVRDAACLAFTHSPPAKVPVARLLRELAKSTDEPARASLLRALSYGDAPEAFLALHRFVLGAEGPCFDVAVARLAEEGNGFSLRVLARAAAKRPGAATSSAIEAARAKIERRDRALREQRPQPRAERTLALAAWGEVQEDELARELGAWGREQVGELASDPRTTELVRKFAPGKATDLRDAIERAVRR